MPKRHFQPNLLLRLSRAAALLSIGFLFFGNATSSRAVLTDTFRVELGLSLCGEVGFQSVKYRVYYSIGEAPEKYLATVLSKTIDKVNLLGTFEVELPATLGRNEINLTAVCENAAGLSAHSNVVSISNCDSLATIDSDGDGLTNAQEDLNCDNFFSPGDFSNPFNVDTDGDGVRDLVEVFEGTSPTNPGSSPRPFIYSGAPFDPDGDNNANPTAWRPSNGTWYIKDFLTPGQNLTIPFGQSGDVPFVYNTPGGASNVGAIRANGTSLTWYFNGLGFLKADASRIHAISFGIFGDNLLPGPWESAGTTSPAVARLYNNNWFFYIYLADGTAREAVWGGDGDIPKVQDYDGDGLFDVAVFRPSEQKTYVINSSNGNVRIIEYGSGTADHSVRGDVTGDGTDDLTFWEPRTGVFTTLKSDTNFNFVKANEGKKQYFEKQQLGLYVVHVPMSWNRQNGKVLYTVVDHANGLRYFRANNDTAAALQVIQWGVLGDALL